MGQEASRWLKRCQDGLNEAPRAPQGLPMAQRGPKMAHMAYNMTPRGPKKAPKWLQDGPQMALRSPQEASNGTKMGPKMEFGTIQKTLIFRWFFQ